MYLGTYTARTGQIVNRWQTLYDGVVEANTVIQNIASVETTDDIKNQYIAEAKFMRALYYSTLMNFFGGVPLYDETLIVDKDFNNMMEPRATLEATRNFILADADAAIASLPVKWDNSNYGRSTKGAAYALKGKVLLFDKTICCGSCKLRRDCKRP